MEQVKLSDGLKKEYIIPCFQREYSWEDEEIEELIKDIKNVNDNEYCLGIITVKKENNKFHLIDGQQRITTLYMIAIYCNYICNKNEVKLSNEYDALTSKDNSLVKLLSGDTTETSQNMQDAWRTIKKNISNEEKENIRRIIHEYLYYYEIELDDKTKLNHYFEVMNSRGIQLSRSDIIKSYLIRKLDNNDDKARLNYLWYKFEKMDFKTSNITSFSEINSKIKNEYKSINDILKHGVKKSKDKENNDEEDDDNSILNFEYFLLYTIRLYNNNLNEDITGEFNLKDLISEYQNTFANSSSDIIVKFLEFLIKTKNVYDKYVVKYNKNDETWKLKNSDMLLIQSCLRVSFINRRTMPWLYKTLAYFLNDERKHDANTYVEEMRDYIRKKYVKEYLTKAKEKGYNTGFDTPNIVLNYLDYLLKINHNEIEKQIPELQGLGKDFSFKFRNSIEHFTPRHKEDGTPNPNWVHNFGNLALLAYGTNTRMQNATPDVKAKHFNNDLASYSIKLQIMSKIALDKSREWNKDECDYLTAKLIKVLEDDLSKSKDKELRR